SITTTQRYMNDRASSLAESMRKAREHRAKGVEPRGFSPLGETAKDQKLVGATPASFVLTVVIGIAARLRSRIRLLRSVLVRTQMPLEKRPRAVPRIALLGGVLALERLMIHATAERVPASRRADRRIHIDLRLREIGLARPERVDHLLILDEVHVRV